MFLTPAYSVGVFFFAANHTANIQNYFLLRVFLYDFPFTPRLYRVFRGSGLVFRQ